MKSTKPSLGILVTAALMGVGHSAMAERQPELKFTPLESLSPQERTALEPTLQMLDRSFRIDWDSVILGVNENGELELRDRKSIDLQRVAEPSCWSSGN